MIRFMVSIMFVFVVAVTLIGMAGWVWELFKGKGPH